MAKDQTGFAKLIGDGLNPKTLEFIKNIKQSLDQPVTDGPPVQPADRFSAPLAKYKNALPAIQQDLEALSSALALWLGTQDEAKTNTPKSTGKGAPAALDAAGAASKAAKAESADSLKPTTIDDFLASVGKAVITATAIATNGLNGETYILTPAAAAAGSANALAWTISGTCKTASIC